MAMRQEARDEAARWAQLMAEVREIEAHLNATITLHTLMHQRSHIGTPVQYERLFLRACEGNKEKNDDHRTGHSPRNRRRISHRRF